MADLSSLTSQETDAENYAIAQRQGGVSAPGEAAGFGEAYAADSDVNAYYANIYASRNAQRDFIQSSLDAYHARYGETLPNPMATVAGFNVQTSDQQANAFGFVRKRFADRAAQQSSAPDAAALGGAPALQFPSDDDIVAGGMALSRKSLGTAADVAQRGGPMATLGELTAGVADGATDPLNALAIAAVPEAALPLRALMMGGAFGASQAAKEALTFGQKQAINPDFGVGEALGDVKSAALGGAAFEVGGAALSKLVGLGWRSLVARDPATASALPLDVHDAGVVSERQADIDANNPFGSSPIGEAAHAENIGTMDPAIIAGRDLMSKIQAEQGFSLPVLGKDDLALTSEAAELRERSAALDEQLGALPAGDPAAAEQLARVQQVERDMGQAQSYEAKRALSQRRDELLTDTTPEALQAAAAPLEQRRVAEAEQSSIASRLDDIAKQQQGEPVFGQAKAMIANIGQSSPIMSRISGALDAAGPEWLAMREAVQKLLIPAGHDITAHVAAAASAVAEADARGVSVGGLMSRGQRFYSDEAQRATGLFIDRETGRVLPKRAIVANLKDLARGLRGDAAAPAAAGPAEALDPITARLTREAADGADAMAVADDPAVHEAMIAGLRRNMEQGNNRVPIEDAEGNVTLGFVDKELAELDAQSAAAKEIAACVTPQAEAAE